jgi:putative ABC transport system permease protein
MPEWKQEIGQRLAKLMLEPARESAIIEELSQHLEDCYEESLAGGATPAEAERRALAELSDREILAGELRRVERQDAPEPIVMGTNRRGNMIQDLWQDLRFGLRMLVKNPGVTAIAALSLALGIGANTAIFSLIDATLLRMLPIKDPRRLALFSVNRQGQSDYDFNYPFYERLRENQRAFSGLIGASGVNRMRMQAHDAQGTFETVQQERVTGNYFSVLGVNATLGRALNEDDDSAANPQAVVVLSYEFWRRRFALDPSVIGKKITLDDFPFTIVGIAPQGFTGLEVGRRPDLWWPVKAIPLVSPDSRALKDEGYTWLKVMGRLKPGASLEQARAEMDVLFKQQIAESVARQASLPQWQRSSIESTRLELETGSAGWTMLRQQFKNPMLILMTVVALVLLIACANVANLLLAAAAARRKEIAVRLALGASRLRLMRQLLTESALLALMGGALGLAFAQWGSRALVTYLPRQNPVSLDLRPDARALMFTLAASLLTGLLFGLAPALQASRLDLTSSLKDQIGASGRRVFRLRLPLHKALVVAQVALSLFLLIGAGLFARSLQNLKAIDLGFERDNLVEFRLDTGKGYNRAQRANLYKQMLAKLEALPGARAASFSSFGLLSGNRIRSRVIVPGFVAKSDDDALCNTLSIGPNYFAAMGVPLLSGREFGAQDERLSDPNPVKTPGGSPAQTPSSDTQSGQPQAAQAPLAAVINQAMARHFFGDQNPIGKRFSIESRSQPGPAIEVVGVVKDAKYRNMREAPPRTYYLAWFQQPGNSDQMFQLRTVGLAAGTASAIRRAAQELDPKLQIVGLGTMNERVDELLAQERLIAQLAGFFSLFALLLACLGLYGIMSQSTLRRTREIGVRVALGARRGDVVRMVLRESMSLVVIGALIGLGAAVMTTRFVSTLLYGLAPTDPLTISLAVLVMLGVAALAGYLPARKASQVDPLVALRCE